MQDDDPLADHAMLAPEVLTMWQRARTGMLTAYPDRSLPVGLRLRASDLEAALPRLRAFVETTVRPQEADWHALGAGRSDAANRRRRRLLASAPPDGSLRDAGPSSGRPPCADAGPCRGRAREPFCGRLFEGHVNAVKLLHLHGGPTDGIAQGELRGVWAPTGPIPRISGTGSCTGRSCSPAAPMCWTGSSSR